MAPTTMHSNDERPSKKARANKENGSNNICRLCIFDVESKQKSAQDFFVSLCIDKHSLYDLIDSVFRHVLHKLSGGDSIYSHLWKVTFAGREYDSMLIMSGGSVVCDDTNPRLLHTFNPSKGMKGSFQGESGEFKFVVESVSAADANETYPKFETIATVVPAITASKDSTYISNEEKQQAARMRKAYEEFYSGLNDWKRQKRYDTKEVYITAKPLAPEWGKRKTQSLVCFSREGGNSRNRGHMVFNMRYCTVQKLPHLDVGICFEVKGVKLLNVSEKE